MDGYLVCGNEPFDGSLPKKMVGVWNDTFWCRDVLQMRVETTLLGGVCSLFLAGLGIFWKH